MLSDTELYVLGARTAVACWEQMARGCVGAAIVRAPGVAAAVFPEGPERAVYNNAILSSASVACGLGQKSGQGQGWALP